MCLEPESDKVILQAQEVCELLAMDLSVLCYYCYVIVEEAVAIQTVMAL